MISASRDHSPLSDVTDLPEGWSASVPDAGDAPELTELLRREEQRGRGWASSDEDDVLVHVSAHGSITRENVILRDGEGTLRGWGSAHDRASGRMLLQVVVDRDLPEEAQDRIAAALFDWAEDAAKRIGEGRDLDVQQIDSGAFADDSPQHRWLERAGYDRVRHWWQMIRPVSADEASLDAEVSDAVRIRRVERQGTGMPAEDDLRTVHDILEESFADHFNSHEESFDEFVFRLREDPGHRWDHWWIAEVLAEGAEPEPAGTLVGAVTEGSEGAPHGSYVEYLGVRQNARGRGVAKSLLRTIIADAASRGRDRVGLEVDADSPTGADALYVSMGWETRYTTQSWHRDVRVER